MCLDMYVGMLTANSGLLLVGGDLNAAISIENSVHPEKLSQEVSGDVNQGEQKEISDFVRGGYGIGGDVGLLFTPIKPMAPTLGVSVTDFGGTSFTKLDVSSTAIGTPERRLPSVNTGISLRPLESGRHYITTSMDMHAINQPVHFSKKPSG